MLLPRETTVADPRYCQYPDCRDSRGYLRALDAGQAAFCGRHVIWPQDEPAGPGGPSQAQAGAVLEGPATCCTAPWAQEDGAGRLTPEAEEAADARAWADAVEMDMQE